MSEKIVSAHQPNFMPYLGFFDKMKNSDIFVIRDEVLFVKKEFHNRNRIRINSHDNFNCPQSKWISVPVDDPHDHIMHAKIKRDSKIKNLYWNESLLKELRANYLQAKYFKNYFPELEKLFDNSHESLISLNMKIIEFLAESFDIKTKIIFASDLNLKPKNFEKSDASLDLVNICKALKGTIYLSGSGGKTYLNRKPFDEQNIQIEFQNYHHPIYPQSFSGFVPNLAAIDALFCVGKIPEPSIKIEVLENKSIPQILSI